jgi:hypothetical protein
MREDIELLIDRIYLRGNWLHTDTAHFKRSAVVAAVSAAEKIPPSAVKTVGEAADPPEIQTNTAISNWEGRRP